MEVGVTTSTNRIWNPHEFSGRIGVLEFRLENEFRRVLVQRYHLHLVVECIICIFRATA